MMATTTSVAQNLLGSTTEVCIVTPGVSKTTAGLHRLSIGPFQILGFTPATVTDRNFHGKIGHFELEVAFAKQRALVFELMQPTKGASLISEYLATHGGKQGSQHIALDMRDLPVGESRRR
jgi:hypothetical protein